MDTVYLPEWDRENQRFTVPSRCPYPDCAAPVDPLYASEPILSWCAVCQRPYEVVPFKPAEELAPLALNRRPDSAYCTYKGTLLTEYSVLDWSEAGGEPGRSYCLDDARGAVFGAPSPRRTIRVEEDWNQRSILGSRGDDDDHLTSVSVVRGRVVAATARGWIGLFDAASGEPSTGRPLEWPNGSVDPQDPDRAVRWPPAFRGTQMVLVAPHEAQFRDLNPFLFANRVSAARRYRMVEPETGLRFLGPPLGIDGLETPSFCLLEGGEDLAARVIHDAKLRIFDATGEEIASCPAPGIARPPVFDRRLRCIVWVEGNGNLAVLPVERLREAKTVSADSCQVDSQLAVETGLRPTFAVARNAQGLSEVWLSTLRGDGRIALHRAVLDRVKAAATWSWQTYVLPTTGQVAGIAVGLGSKYRNNAASQVVAVATDGLVLSLDRANLLASGRIPLIGPEGVGILGSWDAPIVCPAGVIARIQGSLCVDSQGNGWSDESFQVKVPVPGPYQRAQGLAMFGRRVYLGHGLGIRSYRLTVEEDA